MNFSKNGIQFLKKVEGVELKAYKDTGGIWTIGVGHTGPDVIPNMVANMNMVDNWLMNDVQIAVDAVNSNVKVPLTQNQFDALVSFVFNVGVGAFRSSTLLKLLNQQRYDDIPSQLSRWNKVNGKPVAGLTNRRKAEQDLWNTAE